MSVNLHATRLDEVAPFRFDQVDLDAEPGEVRPIRTLVIEDSEFDRRRIARLCRETGLRFSISSIDCAAGLGQLLNGQKFDLVLVDYRLGDSDGLKAVRQIRKHPRHLACPILMLTGMSDIHVAIDAMKSGCSDYIAKERLNAVSLRDAALSAIEQSSLQSDLMRARGLDDRLTRLLDEFAKSNAAEMKPIVLKLMRKARARLNSPLGRRNKDAADLDSACRSLWAMLEAMESSAKRL